MAEPRVTLPGSDVAPPPGVPVLGPVDPSERAEVSIYLTPVEAPRAADRTTFLADRAATYADDLTAIAAFATAQGLTVTETDPARRLLRVAGPVGTLAKAFGADVALYASADGPVRARTGTLTLPASLAGKIQAVLGLDGRQVATTKLAFPAAATVAGFLPSDVARLYGVPVAPPLGQGQTIAIIELGGGFRADDTAAAFAAMGLPAPDVTAIGVGNAINAPGQAADTEVALDIQVAGAAAPGAAIAVYFAVNTAQGFVDAISQAAHDTERKPSAISISWGAPEQGWSGQTIAAMNSAIADAGALGITVCCASGDSLAIDGIADGHAHVDFPASSPGALGCGGTRISAAAGAIVTETVWNTGSGGTGGGISDLFPVPDYQAAIALPASANAGRQGRGVPDVAADADPNSGFRIVVGGQPQVIGGTSAAAPLWAGIFAALNARAGKMAGAPHAALYGAGGLRDIVQGDNRANGIGYDARPGWDACTGLGSPDWTALSAIFKA